MSKLAELDNLYKITISKLPEADRLSYCNQKLDKVQYILAKNLDILDAPQKTQLGKMIKAIQDEIERIKNETSFI